MIDYYSKYTKYKSKYLELKTQNAGADNYCKLPRNAKLFFGSGGSDGIIAITSDKAYKYYPLFVDPNQSPKIAKTIENRIKYEIVVIKELTKNLVKTHLTPHIIEYINDFTCNETPDNIFRDCPSYREYLMSKVEATDKCALTSKRGHPRILAKPMHILQMEKADDTLGNELIKISKTKWEDIEIFLDRLYFQVFYTLETIKSIYPDYSHNDLFIRNILVKYNDANKNEYYRYHINGKTFDIPAQGLFIKINDFGLNDLTQKITNEYDPDHKVLKNPYRDYFSILYDVYNGANLGGKSLYDLIKKQNKLKMVDRYFQQFMDIKIIKKIIKNNKKERLDWDWNKTLDNDFVKLISLKKFSEYINHFIEIYPVDDIHDIIEEYGL